jgi:uncharacterized protein YqeY
MLYSQIKEDRLSAQKAGDSRLVGILKLILSELSYAQVDYKEGELPDIEVVRVLMKEAKKRRDSIEVYTKVNSPERVVAEEYELSIIEKYLPKMMSEAEVLAEITKTAEETGLLGGKLMGAAMGKLKGKVEGAMISRLVNERFKA